MSSYTIVGNTIVFKNPYGLQDINLKHSTADYNLIFDSPVKFNKDVQYSSVKLGDWTIKPSDDNSELIISKNDRILAIFEDS